MSWPGVSQRRVATNGITLNIAEAGEGPLVLLLHGFPESWYSWRHQFAPLAAAGYHVVAPDMRGYGKSDKPAAVTDYDIHHTTADIVGLIDAYGAEKAIVIGRGGSRLREVGTNARRGIEALLGERVHLDLHVKVAKDWQRDPKQLGRLGF